LTVYNKGSIVDNLSMGKPNDLVQGMLDLLILKTLLLEPKHGWAIAKRTEEVSSEVLQGSAGLPLSSASSIGAAGRGQEHMVRTETGRQAKLYSRTLAGCSQLDKELPDWERLSSAVNVWGFRPN
jgi:PadR family transcriptional regulator, regulatory protein PadR